MKKSATEATWKRSQRRTRVTWKKVSDMRNLGHNQRQARLVKKVSDGRNMKKKSATALSELAKKSVTCATLEKLSDGGDLGKIQRSAHIEKEVSDGLERAGKKYQRRVRSGKKVSDVRNMKKKSAKALSELTKKSVTCATLEKLSDGGDLGKSQRCAHIDKEVSDGFVRAGKKYQRWARSGKKVSDGCNLKKKSATALCELAKKKSATGSTWENVSDVRTLTKKSATNSCELAKFISDGRDLGEKSATCATWDTISDRRDLWKIPRRAQPEKEVSDGLNLGINQRLAHLKKEFRDVPERIVIKNSDRHISKKTATGATWKRSQRRPCASWQKVGDRRGLWKKSATGASWKRRLRRIGATWKKLSDGDDLGKRQRCAHIDKEVSDEFVRAGKIYQRRARSGRKVSDMRNLGHNQRQARPVKKFHDGRNLKKKSATGLTSEKIKDWHIERRAQIDR